MTREERDIERYVARRREERNSELRRRMERERTFEELLGELLSAGGLNVAERERARGACPIL